MKLVNSDDMAGQADDIVQTVLDGKYLLVSDSNEVSQQLDSKKLNKDDLVYMAEDNLFKKYLTIMSKYLTKTRYQAYIETLSEKLRINTLLLGSLPTEWSKKFKPVDGQVILISVDELDRLNQARAANHKDPYNPLEYLKLRWDITSDFNVTQMQDCMMCGVTKIDSVHGDEVMRQSNQRVELTARNIPPHMHHSGITSSAKIESMQGENTADKSKFLKDALVYDMFYNESFETGVDFNELNGVIDNFTVERAGESFQKDQNSDLPADRIFHDNLPAYKRYYVFVLRQNSI